MENLLNECLISVRSISKQKEETFKVSSSCEGCTKGLFFPWVAATKKEAYSVHRVINSFPSMVQLFSFISPYGCLVCKITIAQEYCLVSVIILHSFVCKCIARKSYSNNLDMPPSIPHCPYWGLVLASDIR